MIFSCASYIWSS
uniref:Uncharacterized protein n=1 Tax=Arundo donax TaxID=35708 RepID=A0A0A9CCT7_ARUDO